MKRVVFIVIFLSTILVFIINDQSPRRGGELRIALPGDVGSLTPWDSFYTVRTKFLINIYEQLTSPDWNRKLVGPGIAASWDVEKEGKVFTFYLRKGVRFSNGKPLTADDVIASAGLFPLSVPFRIEKVDPMTVRLTIDEPNSLFSMNLVHIELSVAPSSSVAEYKKLKRASRLDEFRPMGSGPFKFKEEKKEEIILLANDDCWRGRSYIDRILYRVISENNKRIAALEQGEIDLIDVIFPRDLERLKRNPNLVVKSVHGLNICYLAMNNKRKPFTDARVRRAVALALNKLILAKRFVYGGYGIPTNRPLSPSFFGFPSLPRVGSYNPVMAKKLLGEAGYPDGFSARLVVIPLARPYLPDPKGCAEEIKKELDLIGIKVKIVVPEDYAGYDKIVSEERDFDLCLGGWNSYVADPDFMLGPILGGPEIRGEVYGNLSRWENKAFDAKLIAARRLPLSMFWERVKLYNEAVKIFEEELPLIPLFHTRVFVIYNKRVKGVKLFPNGMIFFNNVWLER
jgi:ABC-type transport system substrate-binding protein